MKRDGAEAVIVQPLFFGHVEEVVRYAMKSKLPVISDYPVFAKAGGPRESWGQRGNPGCTYGLFH